MKFSESIKNIAPAMLKVQGEIKGIRPDGSNPHFGKSYITLDGMLEYARPKLTENGIWVIQNVCGDTESIEVVTRLIHAQSGEWIESDPLRMRPLQTTPQGMGSAITYAKRYSLSSMLGISSEVDDDGNEATKPRDGTGNHKQKVGQYNKTKIDAKTAYQTIVPFGEYKDKTLAEVYKIDKAQFNWIAENAKAKNLKEACQVIIEAVAEHKAKKQQAPEPVIPTDEEINAVIDEGVPF